MDILVFGLGLSGVYPDHLHPDPKDGIMQQAQVKQKSCSIINLHTNHYSFCHILLFLEFNIGDMYFDAPIFQI